MQEGNPWRRKNVSEWFLTDEEQAIIWIALDHAIADCFLSDEEMKIAGPLHDEFEPDERT